MALRVGTRKSALALAQTKTVVECLEHVTGESIETVMIDSDGDTMLGSLAAIGGTGVFASALRRSLVANHCDLVVHSHKDLPVAPFDGLAIGATPERSDPRDALCAIRGLSLDELPRAGRVGTGSPRRAAALLAVRPDLVIVDIRGNIDTRLERVGTDLDAVVLAVAGLTRLNRLDAISQIFPFDVMPSAPGQGALALEARVSDLDETDALGAGLRHMGDVPTGLSVIAEREVLAYLEGGCTAPIGAHAQIGDNGLTLVATVLRPDGTESLTRSATVPVPTRDVDSLIVLARELGHRVARDLFDAGAPDLAPLGATQ